MIYIQLIFCNCLPLRIIPEEETSDTSDRCITVMDKSEKEISLWVFLMYGERSNHLTDDKLSGLYETCLQIAQDINDSLTADCAQIFALQRLGLISFRHSQFIEAIKYSELSLNIAKKIGMKSAESKAYGILGACYESLGDYNKAVHHHLLCLNIATETGDKEVEGHSYGNLGNCYRSLGQYNKAIHYQLMSLDIATQTGNKAVEGGNYSNLGICYYSLAQYNKAIHYHEMGLRIAKQIGNKEAEARAYGSLGACYSSLGQYDKAIHHQLQSLDIARQTGNKAGEGHAYTNLGICYYSLAQYHKAVHHNEIGLRIAKQIGAKEAEGCAYGNLGTCYSSLQQYDKAELCFTKQLEIAEQIGDEAGKSCAHGSLGTCYSAFRQYDKAIHHYRLYLNIGKRIGNKLDEGKAHGSIGICYFSTGQYEKAKYHTEIHLSMAKQIGNKAEEAAARSNLSAYYLSLEQYQKAELQAEESLQCFEKLFENTPKQDQFKISIRDTFISTHRLLTEILLNQGKTKESLAVAEKGRARALAELMHHSVSSRHVDVLILDFCGIIEFAKSLHSLVIYLSFSLSGVNEWIIQLNGDIQLKKGPKTQSVAAAEQEIMSLITKAHKQDMTRCIANCEDRSLSFLYPEDETENDIEKTDSFVAPELLDSLVLLDISSTSSSTIESVMDKERGITTRAVHPDVPDKRTCSAKTPDGSETNPLKTLYQLVWAPLQEHVKGNQVVVIADGMLNLVPFSALMNEDGHYVAESLQVRLVPSLSTAKMILDRPQEPGSEASPLIVGDPDVSVIFPKVGRLPCARKEAQMIGHLFGVQPLTGENATKESFLQNAESASLIHIAAHGDMKRGEILFALNTGINRETAKKEDYLLQMSDLEQKHLKAKLVVLSCCNSARGQVRADGVIGIARAFLGAGARSVLVALWKINDEATLFFMRIFYQHLSRGEMASEALDQAMKAMRNSKEFDDPRYWAPFVLIGDNISLF